MAKLDRTIEEIKVIDHQMNQVQPINNDSQTAYRKDNTLQRIKFYPGNRLRFESQSLGVIWYLVK